MRVDTIFQKHHPGCPESLGGAHDCAGIARVLKAVQNHDEGEGSHQLWQSPSIQFYQRKDPLRSLGRRKTGEYPVGDTHNAVLRAAQLPPPPPPRPFRRQSATPIGNRLAKASSSG